MTLDEKLKIIEQKGWTVECESPLEIRHEESNSFATNQAARLLIDQLVIRELDLDGHVDLGDFSEGC